MTKNTVSKPSGRVAGDAVGVVGDRAVVEARVGVEQVHLPRARLDHVRVRVTDRGDVVHHVEIDPAVHIDRLLAPPPARCAGDRRSSAPAPRPAPGGGARARRRRAGRGRARRSRRRGLRPFHARAAARAGVTRWGERPVEPATKHQARAGGEDERCRVGDPVIVTDSRPEVQTRASPSRRVGRGRGESVSARPDRRTGRHRVAVEGRGAVMPVSWGRARPGS